MLNQGRVEQIGTPDEVYRAPVSPFAARFVGDSNVIAVDLVQAAGGRAIVAVGGHRLPVVCRDPLAPGPAWLVLRPEVVRVAEAAGDESLHGTVRDFAFRGASYAYRIALAGVAETIKAEVAAEGSAFAVGSEVTISWDGNACSLLKRPPAHPIH